MATVEGNQAVHTDRSGTITAGGSAQTLMAANSARRGWWLQNLSSDYLYFSGVGTAAASQPSFRVDPGGVYEAPMSGISTTALSIFGPTTGQAFSAREW